MTVGAMTSTSKDLRAIGRVQAIRPHLSPAMSKIADLVLADPSDLPHLSITEVASRAGSSAATVTRFARALGYASYAQFRIGLASDIGHEDAHESWRADIGRECDPQDAPDDLLRALLSTHARALEATAALIELDEVRFVAKAVWNCAHLDVYGIGGSAEMASELQARLYRIGVNTHAWGEVHAGLASAAILPENSVAVALSNSGRTDETIELLQLARQSGAFTVAITSDRNSPLADVADACVANATSKTHPQPDDLSAKHAQLLVLDLLYLLVAQQDYAATADKLTASRVAVTSHRRPLGAARPRPRPPPRGAR
ncbi:MurR/RpiR family transcriptional regulator [soil metagenome]